MGPVLSTNSNDDLGPVHHVITKAEAEEALDRCEFERIMRRRGADTMLTWWYQEKLNLPRQQATDMEAVRRG
jgi:hypothetical protein